MSASPPFQISIIGRPNVGKSTLFNSLLRKRRAITAPEPGVTRDTISEPVLWNGVPVLLSDSGGIMLETQDPLDRTILSKSLETVRQADLLIWLISLNEFTPEDQLIREFLYPMRHKTILAVNKADITEKEPEAYNYYQLGFETLIPISALHNRNLEQLRDECLNALRPKTPAAGTPEPEPAKEEPPAIRFVLIGQTNTGKSSLNNALLQREASLVSDLSGTTRDVLKNSFVWDRTTFELSDTAGIRRKSKVKENVEYYSVHRAIRSLDEADLAVLLIDSSVGLQQQDKKIAQQIIKRGRGLIIGLNKIDLCPQSAKMLKALDEETKFAFPHLAYVPICKFSALTGKGIPDLLRTMKRVYAQLTRRIGTGLLNQALQHWISYHPPPSRSKPFRVRYITQVNVNPLEFVLFVNRSKGFPQQYIHFIQNQIRRELGFPEVPISIHLRE